MADFDVIALACLGLGAAWGAVAHALGAAWWQEYRTERWLRRWEKEQVNGAMGPYRSLFRAYLDRHGVRK